MIATAIITAGAFIVLEGLHYLNPAFSYGVAAGAIFGLSFSLVSIEKSQPNQGGEDG